MKIHQIEGYIQTIYLVEYQDKLMLLDGCCRADHDIVLNFITQTLNRAIGDLKVILVTHMHPDHAGGAHKLAQTTGAKIAACNAPGHWYRGLDGVLMHWTDMLLALYVAGRKGKKKQNLFYPRKLRADHFLADGMTIPGFDDWQVMHIPGHTDRDIAAYHIPSERVYVADLMVKVKGKLIPPFPLFYPRRYRNSLLAIKLLQPKSVILAHDGELDFADIDFDSLIESAPTTPMTHWRSVKYKLGKALSPKFRK
jgi:glyoxylase-like metal-dependent hydrolase (beta-lactamase superfamily II)